MGARGLVAVTAVALLCACGSEARHSAGDRPDNAPDAMQPPAEASGAAVADVAVPTACELIPRAEVERIAGPLAGEPKREGNGCWFYIVTDTTAAEWKQRRDNAERARASGMDARAVELYHPTRAGIYVELDLEAAGDSTRRSGPADAQASGDAPEGRALAPSEGWDEVRASPRGTSFHGRTGHVRVGVRQLQLKLAPDTLRAIAGRVRDRIPDGPIPHPAADRSQQRATGQDPCSVLTRDEAEEVLGPLITVPVRTREGTPLADPAGTSCGYFTAGHHVLLLTPTWEIGQVVLNASRVVGGVVGRVADLAGVQGDTLEGPWDDVAVDLTGELVLLKGPHALGIAYRASSTDAAGAIRLAGPALERLAATPARPGPGDAAGSAP